MGTRQGSSALLQSMREELKEKDMAIQALKQENDRLRLELVSKQLKLDYLECSRISVGVISTSSSHSDLNLSVEQASRWLKEFQREGASFIRNALLNNTGAILADEMGLGKTLQFLFASVSFSIMSKTTPCRILVIVPVIVMDRWIDDLLLLRRWIGNNEGGSFTNHIAFDSSLSSDIRGEVLSLWQERGGFLFVGYELCREMIEDPLTTEYFTGNNALEVCCLDEGHRIRNKSRTNELLWKINTNRRIILSGYPLQNNVTELYKIVHFACQDTCIELLGEIETFSSFFARSKQTVPNDASDQFQKRSTFLGKLLQKHDMILRRNVNVLEHVLKPKYDIVVFIKLSSVQKQIYQQLLSDCFGKLSFFELTTAISMLGNHLSVLYESLQRGIDDVESLSRMSIRSTLQKLKSTNGFQQSGKFQVLFKILEDSKGHGDKVVVFSRWLATLDTIEEQLKIQASRYSWTRLDGNSPPVVRDSVLKSWIGPSENCRDDILLMSSKCGEGINLTAANRIVLMDVNWNPNIDMQASMRIFRKGQNKNCFVYRLVCDSSIECKVFERQIKKMEHSRWTIDTESYTAIVQDLLPTSKNFNLGSDENARFSENIRVPPAVTEDPVTSSLFIDSLLREERDNCWITRAHAMNSFFEKCSELDSHSFELEEKAFQEHRKRFRLAID